MLVATLLMSKARLREPIKLSPGGFQTSCPYQPERQFPRNLGKKTPPVSGRRSTSRRRYGGRSPESMLIRSLLRHSLSNQLGRGQKKTPPVSGWRSNYAHLTEIRIHAFRYSFVKRVHNLLTLVMMDSTLVPPGACSIQLSAGHNGLPSSGTMCTLIQLTRVSKHSIVSHRSPAKSRGFFFSWTRAIITSLLNGPRRLCEPTS